jgi:hypothetical protein
VQVPQVKQNSRGSLKRQIKDEKIKKMLPERIWLLGHQSEDVLGNNDVEFHGARWKMFDPNKGVTLKTNDGIISMFRILQFAIYFFISDKFQKLLSRSDRQIFSPRKHTKLSENR